MIIIVFINAFEFIVATQFSFDYESIFLKFSNFEKYFKNFLLNINRVDFNFVSVLILDRWTKRIDHQINFISLKNIKKILNFKKKIDFVTILSNWLQRRIKSFNQKFANELFSHRKYDHIIRFIENKKFDFDFFYNMFQNKLKILNKYIKNNITKSFIKIN
jgi:hypothetical protein